MEFQLVGEKRLRPGDYPRASVRRRRLCLPARRGGHRAFYKQAFALGERDIFFHLRAELSGERLRRREHRALRAAVAYRRSEGRGDGGLAGADVALEQPSALRSGRRAVDYFIYDFLLRIGKFERKVFHHGAEEGAAFCPRRAAFRVFSARGRHRELEREELAVGYAPPRLLPALRRVRRVHLRDRFRERHQFVFFCNFMRNRVF